ncbi:YncE family protein [Bacillus chungangensis]|uniref:Lipoprotein n=1 Tax=Bacillus chungangensis TaxID=587633 RepID=A0ABT9WN97_9BACI|nr:WD40 repeat domain-containing protein [Bacillus chungangensis]MDQ0174741.1 hypothetical protein [Bacillus chungangensis]
MRVVKYLLLLSVFLLLSSCGQPLQQAIWEKQHFVATLNLRDKSLTFLNETGDTIAKWELKQQYTGGFLLPNRDTLVLYGTEEETVDLYSLKTGSIEKRLKTGKGMTNGLYLPSKSQFVFTDKEKNEVRFFDRNGKEVKSIATGTYPMTMKLMNDQLVIACYQDTILQMIDIENYEVTKEMHIHSDSAGMLVREEAGELWVGGHGSGKEPRTAVAIYSLADGTLKEEIEAPLMPVNFHEDHDGIYVLSHGTNSLYHFNHDKKKINHIHVGANPFAMESFAGKLIVAGYDSDEVYWIHPQTLEIEKKVKVGTGPFVIIKRE